MVGISFLLVCFVEGFLHSSVLRRFVGRVLVLNPPLLIKGKIMPQNYS